MTEPSAPKRKKRQLITRKNRSAWIISFILIVMMTLRLVAGLLRPSRVDPVASATPTALVEPAATVAP